jgi:hypothetical protein
MVALEVPTAVQVLVAPVVVAAADGGQALRVVAVLAAAAQVFMAKAVVAVAALFLLPQAVAVAELRALLVACP